MRFSAVAARSLAVSVIAALAIAALAGSGCSERSDVETVAGDTGTALDGYMSAIVPYGFSGSLLVARGGDVVLRKGYGLADEASSRPNTASTVFSIGSITKQFTATAVLLLEMEGLLSTDDPITEFFEDVPPDKGSMTLHHLLTHTAGVVGSTGDDFEPVGRDEVVRRVLSAPLEFEPGTRMSYSNAGYSLLAAVVEKVSGVRYEEFLWQRIFEPAGMRDTGYVIPDWNPARLARWYDGTADNGTLLDRNYPRWNLVGNGGIMSTLDDMLRWCRALEGDLILDEAARTKLWTPFLDDYAYGWDVLDTPRGRLVQHDGGSTLGASAELRWFLDEDVIIILFCNRSYGGVPLFEVVREEIEELAFGGEVEGPPPTIELDDETLDTLAGNYALPTGGGLKFTHEGDVLRLLTFDQDVINALFIPEADPETFDDLNARSGRLVGAAVSGNDEVFVEELGDPDAADRVQRLLQSDLMAFAERTGSQLTASVSLGTVQMGEGGTAISGIRVRNAAGGAMEMSFWWRDGRLIGLDQQGFEMSIPFAPVSENEFVGYHLAFARPNRARFELDDRGRVTGVVLGTRQAQRTGAFGHHRHGDNQRDNGTPGGGHGQGASGHERDRGTPGGGQGQGASGHQHGHGESGR